MLIFMLIMKAATALQVSGVSPQAHFLLGLAGCQHPFEFPVQLLDLVTDIVWVGLPWLWLPGLWECFSAT